jgi:prevent-host-death family protein
VGTAAASQPALSKRSASKGLSTRAKPGSCLSRHIVYFVHFIYNGQMKTVSATDAKQRFAAVIDAAQREPVRVRRQNRDVAIILSPEEYDRMRGVSIDELDRLCERVSQQAAERGLTDAILAELLKD